MKPKEERLRNSSLYLILDSGSLRHRDPCAVARGALKGGVSMIQLRDKCSHTEDIIAYGRRLKVIAGKERALFIINDRVDICQALDADGVHLGEGDMPASDARSLLGERKIIGMTCRTVRQALSAYKDTADYIAVGPIFNSPTKPELKPCGVDILRKVKRAASIPLVAIGGITEGNITSVVNGGADIVAVGSALLRATDIEGAAASLAKKMMTIRKMNHDAT